jgi:SAM-dependent methyltransferase
MWGSRSEMKSVKNALKLALAFPSRPGDVLWFLRTYRQWQKSAAPEWRARFMEIKPCLKDRRDAAGSARGHYFLQDIWAARLVHKFAPEEHVDVGSRVDGFVAHVASFCRVKYVDIRPITTGVPGLAGVRGSVCNLPFGDREIASLSCLHVIEHIGLGRYADPLDPGGWLTGLGELQRVLAPGGQLLLGTPCGRSRVVFHAHRVFAPQQIVNALPELKLEEFSLIEDGRATAWRQDAKFGDTESLDYGCGLFRFTRPR